MITSQALLKYRKQIIADEDKKEKAEEEQSDENGNANNSEHEQNNNNKAHANGNLVKGNKTKFNSKEVLSNG